MLIEGATFSALLKDTFTLDVEVGVSVISFAIKMKNRLRSPQSYISDIGNSERNNYFISWGLSNE